MSRTRIAHMGACAAALAVTATFAAPADAAGLYFTDRGVRPLARAGAFVAGADDLGAIAYNPAGIYDAGAQVLFDASWVHYTSDFARQAYVRQVDPNTGATTGTFLERFPSVHGTTPVLPIPTLAVSFQPHKKLVVALGAWGPYAALTTYADVVAGKPGAQRYSLITLDGSALAFVGAAIAYAPSKEWRLGIEGGVLTGKFSSTVDFSGCVPERFFCAPEDPSWDVLAQLNVSPIVAPTGQAGVTFIPTPKWRIGAAFQLPVFVRAGATMRTRLPATPVFERASQEGQTGSVSFNLPWILRFGVETRVVPDLRVEAGFAFERWSMHDQISLTPDHVALKNVVGFPPTYYIPPISLPRNFRDAASVRLGGEYAIPIKGLQLDARAGVSFETSAVPTPYLSALTIDLPKVTTALGVGLHVGKWRFDLTYAHAFGLDVTVDPAQAKVTQVSPVNANPSKNPEYINGGTYSARADVLGVGLAYTFGAPAEEAAPAAPAAAVE